MLLWVPIMGKREEYLQNANTGFRRTWRLYVERIPFIETDRMGIKRQEKFFERMLEIKNCFFREELACHATGNRRTGQAERVTNGAEDVGFWILFSMMIWIIDSIWIGRCPHADNAQQKGCFGADVQIAPNVRHSIWTKQWHNFWRNWNNKHNKK